MKNFSLALVFMLAAGCGVGLEDTTGPNVDREIKNEKLRGEYESVRGTYEGSIRLGGDPKEFPVRLYIWTGEVQEAPQPGDLKPGIRVVLRGRLMQSGFIGDSDNLIMTGQFDSLTGRLRLDPDAEISKTPTGCRLGGQDPITIAGSFTGDTVSGSVLRNGQEWATFTNMKRISLEVSNGSVLSEEQEYRRLQETYAPYTGMYDGDLNRRVCDSNRREDFDVWLYIERVAEGTGTNGTCYVPRLTLRTLRDQAGELPDVIYRSINRFDPNNILPQFISSDSKFNSKVNLAFRNDRLEGEIATSGRWGTFSVKRTADQVIAPDDERELARERLNRSFSKFVGDYRGKNDAYSGPDWPVKLLLYIDEGDFDGFRRPILRALYTRPDFSDDTIGQRLMDVTVNLDGCTPVLAMKSEPELGRPIPGTGIMRFTATFANGTLTGELADHRGPQGKLTVKRR